MLLTLQTENHAVFSFVLIYVRYFILKQYILHRNSVSRCNYPDNARVKPTPWAPTSFQMFDSFILLS